MARIDAFLKLGVAAGLLGSAPGGGRTADAAHARRSDADQVSRPGEAELESYITEVLTQSQLKHLRAGNDLDFSYVSADGGRFRVNVYPQGDRHGRGLPRHSHRRCRAWRSWPAAHRAQALRLPSGNDPGDRLDRHRQDHHPRRDDRLPEFDRNLNIISLEDPIEFVHRSKSSQVIQRELGTHIPSFAEGVRAAMREDPDVILVGEMRDAETISMAMTAAETGHLVLGTLHTTSAVKTIDRIIDALPVEEREQTKSFWREPDRRHHPDPAQDTRSARAARGLRGHGAHQGDRQAHHDRSVAPDPESACRWARNTACNCWIRRCSPAINAKEVDPDQAYAYASDKRQFQRFVTDMACAPPADRARKP
jgi:twitching motility protein PilT